MVWERSNPGRLLRDGRHSFHVGAGNPPASPSPLAATCSDQTTALKRGDAKKQRRAGGGRKEESDRGSKHRFYLSLGVVRPLAGWRRTGLFALRVVSDGYQRDRERRGSLAPPAPSLMTALGTRTRQQRLKIAAQPAATAAWADKRRGRSFRALAANTIIHRRREKKKRQFEAIFCFRLSSNWLFSLCDRAALARCLAGRLSDSDGI